MIVAKRVLLILLLLSRTAFAEIAPDCTPETAKERREFLTSMTICSMIKEPACGHFMATASTLIVGGSLLAWKAAKTRFEEEKRTLAKMTFKNLQKEDVRPLLAYLGIEPSTKNFLKYQNSDLSVFDGIMDRPPKHRQMIEMDVTRNFLDRQVKVFERLEEDDPHFAKFAPERLAALHFLNDLVISAGEDPVKQQKALDAVHAIANHMTNKINVNELSKGLPPMNKDHISNGLLQLSKYGDMSLSEMAFKNFRGSTYAQALTGVEDPGRTDVLVNVQERFRARETNFALAERYRSTSVGILASVALGFAIAPIVSADNELQDTCKMEQAEIEGWIKEIVSRQSKDGKLQTDSAAALREQK